MSHFRTLVEGIMNEYWGHNPYDDDDGEDKYLDWLEEQDYRTGYAVYLGKDNEGEDVFATADKSIPEEPDYTPSTQIESQDVFEYKWNNPQEESEARRKAEEFANEWKEHFPDNSVELVRVYSKDEDGYLFHRTKQEVYPFENWDYDEYLDDKRATASEFNWELENGK